MTIRWTQPANDDFLGIIEWLNDRNPAAAVRVGRQILDSVQRLAEHSVSRKARALTGYEGTGYSPVPYLVIDAVTPGATMSEAPRIDILRVLHGAMLWPRPGT